MKRFLKIIALQIAIIMCISTTTFAAENNSLISDSETEAGNLGICTDNMETENCTYEIVYSSEEDISLTDFEIYDNIEITDLIVNEDISKLDEIVPEKEIEDISLLAAPDPDPYEPNDTVQTAYNYNLIPEMNGYLYNMGFKNASLHTINDEDWYYTTLTAGNIYFLDLRNIGSDDFNISLFHFNDDGTFDYITSVGDTRFTNRPEKYYYFQPDKSGTYYVCITGNGTTTTSLNYFFYIGDVQRTFTYTNSIGVGVPVFGNTYQTGKLLNLTGTVVPYDSIVLSMAFSNDFSGEECTECQKRIIASDGSVYYSSSAGGTDILNIANRQYLDQIWTISARCTNGAHVTTWTPRITARYSCIMQPYPGNEIE